LTIDKAVALYNSRENICDLDRFYPLPLESISVLCYNEKIDFQILRGKNEQRQFTKDFGDFISGIDYPGRLEYADHWGKK